MSLGDSEFIFSIGFWIYLFIYSCISFYWITVIGHVTVCEIRPGLNRRRRCNVSIMTASMTSPIIHRWLTLDKSSSPLMTSHPITPNRPLINDRSLINDSFGWLTITDDVDRFPDNQIPIRSIWWRWLQNLGHFHSEFKSSFEFGKLRSSSIIFIIFFSNYFFGWF